jgi:very-short-patch-repair endonuclease
MRNKCPVNNGKQRLIRQFLRNNQTNAEGLLWQYLRGKELGVRFVRQYGIRNYIADFCCRSQKLIIEIDGGIHNTQEVKEYDKERTENLENLGYTIIRFNIFLPTYLKNFNEQENRN